MPASTRFPIVRCADELRAFHDGYWKRAYRKMAAIMIPAVIVNMISGKPWPMLVGIAATAGFVLVPYFTSYQRRLRSIVCPHCGKEAGHVTRQGVYPSRLFLSCVHCGVETTTDCVTWGNSGKPEKLEP